MERSENITELAGALVKAQAKIEGAAKDGKGNYGTYSTLGSVMDACKDALLEQDISFVQTFEPSDPGTLSLRTVLLHKSGQFISGACTMPLPRNDPQSYGSAATYARRYSLAAMVGVCPEDDDGEGAMPKRGQQQQRQQPAPARQQQKAEPDAETVKLARELKTLLPKAKLPDGTTRKWLEAANAATFEAMGAERLAKCLSYARSHMENQAASNGQGA